VDTDTKKGRLTGLVASCIETVL